MKLAHQFGVVFLLVLYLTPAMACMTSDVPMNAEEKSCCTSMQNHCEQIGMSTSHRCCDKVPVGARDNALATNVLLFHPIAIATLWLGPSAWLSPMAVTGRAEHPDDSPPASPPATVSILRI
jgi:hypothetical protein